MELIDVYHGSTVQTYETGRRTCEDATDTLLMTIDTTIYSPPVRPLDQMGPFRKHGGVGKVRGC